MARRRLSALVFATTAVAVVALLSACSADASGDPTTTPSPSSSNPASADPLAAVDAIVVAGDGLHLNDGSTTLRVLDYRDPAADTIDALTSVLGEPTGTQEVAGTNHTAPSTATAFGGLSISTWHYADAATPDYLATPAWSVRVTAATQGDVRLTTTAGLTIGSALTAAKGVGDDLADSLQNADGTRTQSVLVELSPGSPQDRTAGPVGVLVIAADAPGPITSIAAPAMYGGA